LWFLGSSHPDGIDLIAEDVESEDEHDDGDDEITDVVLSDEEEDYETEHI
jgi:hypothetical protein